jgi:drug/metabolite transporter (DMT)-like permease
MNIWLLLCLISITTVIGDYFIKTATLPQHGMASAYFAFGLFFYSITGVGWFFVMRSHTLAKVGVFYSATTIIFLAALGVVIFKESFGIRDALGIALALASVAVIGSKA